VTVSATPVTGPRPDDFLGLAFTYRELPRWFPAGPPRDTVLPSLIRNLTPVGRPSLRIGGESADRSWWPIAGRARPLGIRYDLGPAWVASALSLARATDPNLMFGLELEADQPQLDRVEATQLLRRIGRHYIQSLQIGNEPDLYTIIPWYRLDDGRPVPWFSKVGSPVFARKQPFTPDQYVAEVARVLRAIPPYPIAGPETDVDSWLQSFSAFLAPAGPATMLTSHAYGVDACDGDRSAVTYPTVSHLLAVNASRHELLPSTDGISLAHAHGAGFRIDELGAVTCGGPTAVSGSMASALWAVDALFYAASQGVDGVNLHDAYARSNNLFSVTMRHGRWRATTRPLYDGALMFARADPAGSRLLAASTDAASSLRVWASEGADHDVRVTLINDSLGRDADVAVRIPASPRAAVGGVQTLQAPGGARATAGVTIAGRTVSATGALAAPRPAAVAATHGVFEVTVPKGSVALLTVPRSAAAGGCADVLLPPRYRSAPCAQLRAASARGRSAATSSHGRVLTTASALSHARRAVAIP
jgi:hypothetical protein